MKSYDVKFWAIRPGKAKTKRTYEVRWKVGHRTAIALALGTKAQAENFLSELRQAARKGEAFDTETGLPDSMMTTASRERSWLAFCLAYLDIKWPSAAPKTLETRMTDALATLIPASHQRGGPGRRLPEHPPRGAAALRAGTTLPRDLDRPPAIVAALRWLEKASLPVGMISKPQHARTALDAISVLQDGRAASATTIARKRSVFANVIRYAVELEEMPSSPLDRLSWKPPKVSEMVDRRVVVNPRQARVNCSPPLPMSASNAAAPMRAASGSWRSVPACTSPRCGLARRPACAAKTATRARGRVGAVSPWRGPGPRSTAASD